MNSLEYLPILFGAAIGFTWTAFRSRFRLWTLVLAVALAGISCTLLTGEWRINWAFAALDTLSVLCATALTLALVGVKKLRQPATRV